eukprot:7377327-Prymnesium_polylepis.1
MIGVFQRRGEVPRVGRAWQPVVDWDSVNVARSEGHAALHVHDRATALEYQRYGGLYAKLGRPDTTPHDKARLRLHGQRHQEHLRPRDILEGRTHFRRHAGLDSRAKVDGERLLADGREGQRDDHLDAVGTVGANSTCVGLDGEPWRSIAVREAQRKERCVEYAPVCERGVVTALDVERHVDHTLHAVRFAQRHVYHSSGDDGNVFELFGRDAAEVAVAEVERRQRK